LQDVIDYNITPVLSRSENIGEYTYTQFYNLIKTPGNTAGVYPFQNYILENLALDPEYIKFLRRKGSITSFLMTVYINSYLYSKERAYISFAKSQ
jgi:hypothetical protein